MVYLQFKMSSIYEPPLVVACGLDAEKQICQTPIRNGTILEPQVDKFLNSTSHADAHAVPKGLTQSLRALIRGSRHALQRQVYDYLWKCRFYSGSSQVPN